jgi:hypothetical protein
MDRSFVRHFAGPVAGLRLFVAASLTGALLAAGCGKVTSTPVAPAAVDTGVAAVKIVPAATSVAPGSELPVSIQVSDKNGAPVKDGTTVSVLNDALGAVVPSTTTTVNGTAKVTFRAGTTVGTSTIKATAGGATHSTVVTIAHGAAPPPTPTDGTPGAGGDMLNPSLVSWDEPAGNVGAWKITSKIVSASMGGDRYTIIRDPMNNWPSVQLDGWTKPSIGNWWVIGKCSDGRWHAATVDWLGPGKISMEKPFFNGRDDIHGFLSTWRPHSGETAYAMQSTHARSGVIGNNRQRTNIYKITMP